MTKTNFLNDALNEFSKKYDDFCKAHRCKDCALAAAATKEYPYSVCPRCKMYVIDHLVEANSIMTDALEKEAEAKKKKENTARYLVCAIKAEKRDLEYRNRRDAEYIVLNPDDEKLLEAVPGFVILCCRMDEQGFSKELFGMRVITEPTIERGKFVIGFETDSHLKFEEANRD